MAYTMQQLVDRARIPLNDSAKDRYTDATLLGYAIDGLERAVAKRPDLLIDNWGAAYNAYVLATTFPLSNRYFQILADYVTARAQLVDDEKVDEGRFAVFMAGFEQKLVAP